MKQLTINIPDMYVSDFIEYFSHIPNASIINASDFVLTPEMLTILDESHSIENSKFLSIDDSNQMLKLRLHSVQ